MKKIISIFWIIALSWNFAAAGQVQTLSVSNAIELAIRNNLQLKQTGEDIEIAKAQLGQSFADYVVPKVSANGSFSYLDPLTVQNGILDSFTVGPPSGGPLPFSLAAVEYTNVFADNYSAGISVSKTIFNGFRLWNSMRIKQISLDLAYKKFEDKKREIVYNTLYTFYNLFLLKENIRLAEEQNESLSNQMRNVQLNFDSGSATEYDRVRVRVLFQNNQPRLLTARNSYRTTRISFCDSLGIKDYDNVEFIGNLNDFTNLIVTGLSEKSAIEKVLSNDINLKAQDATIEIQKITRDYNDAGKYPVLSASFSVKDEFKKENMTNDSRSWVPSWNAGLVLTIPVDDWLPFSRTANSVNEAEANIRKSQEARQQLVDSLTLQAKTLLYQLDVSKINVAGQMEGLKQAKLGLDIANERYAAGSALVSEIVDSEFSYTQAQTGYLQAIFDYYSATLKLKRLIGE